MAAKEQIIENILQAKENSVLLQSDMNVIIDWTKTGICPPPNGCLFFVH